MTQRRIFQFLLLAIGSFAGAQTTPEDPIRREVRLLAHDPDRLEDFAQNYVKLEVMRQASKKAYAELLVYRRTDIQAGSSSGASGTTSAVLSPLLPAIFGLSFENGAITRAVSGNTITFKANPAGLFCATGNNMAAVAARSDEVCKTAWKRVGITASFDMSRGEKKAELADLRTLNNQFTELTVRVELLNRRTLTGAKFEKTYLNVAGFATKAQALVRTFGGLPPTLWTESSRKIAEALTAAKLATLADEAARTRAIDAVLAANPVESPLDAAQADELQRNWLSALRAFRAQQDEILNAAVVTLDYSYQQPDLATAATANATVPAGTRPPNLHTIRVNFGKGWPARRLDVAANTSASWFADTRPGMSGSFRDYRAGAQAVFKLKELAGHGVPTLNFAALYTYLHQRPLGLGITAFNQAKINEKGHMGVFQAKLEFPTGNNAVRVPISFTYSNRTELIKESDVRGQIGISFNLDSFFAK